MKNDLQFRFDTEIVQLIGNDFTRLEREQLRSRDLERDYPAVIYQRSRRSQRHRLSASPDSGWK